MISIVTKKKKRNFYGLVKSTRDGSFFCLFVKQQKIFYILKIKEKLRAC